MFRFFRQLRLHLLGQHRFGRYLLYAIGEIILVVIGILLALQINTWNQERENRAEEKKYLLRLEQDLKRDLTRLDLVRNNYEHRLVLALQILDSLPGNNERYIREYQHYDAVVGHYSENPGSNRSLGEDLLTILAIEHFAPTKVTFEELLSTGKINILSDDSLKVTLQYHYPNLDETDRFQSVIVMEIQRNFRNTLNDLDISLYSHDNHLTVIQNNLHATKLAVALENYMRTTVVMLNTFYYNHDSAYRKTEELLQRIHNQVNL